MNAIAIDGPAGAGKSTIAKAVAERLEFVYVDTGALYRAIGLFAVENGIEPSDAKALVPRLKEIAVELFYRDGVQRIRLCGRDVTEQIRTPQMGMATSGVSAIPEVRVFLLEMQRNIAERHNVVMDGRDIGTVVLPKADIKIFLTASDEDRARRRYEEYLTNGRAVSYNEVLDDLRSRDYIDMHRAAAPLRQAEDAVLVDTTGLDLNEAIGRVLGIVQTRLKLQKGWEA